MVGTELEQALVEAVMAATTASHAMAVQLTAQFPTPQPLPLPTTTPTPTTFLGCSR